MDLQIKVDLRKLAEAYTFLEEEYLEARLNDEYGKSEYCRGMLKCMDAIGTGLFDWDDEEDE